MDHEIKAVAMPIRGAHLSPTFTPLPSPPASSCLNPFCPAHKFLPATWTPFYQIYHCNRSSACFAFEQLALQRCQLDIQLSHCLCNTKQALKLCTTVWLTQLDLRGMCCLQGYLVPPAVTVSDSFLTDANALVTDTSSASMLHPMHSMIAHCLHTVMCCSINCRTSQALAHV